MSDTIRNNADYDITLDAAGNVALLTGAPAVAQNTRTAMAAQRGEQVFDTDAGMPMAATAFNGLRSAAFEAAARQVIADVDGVASVDEFSVGRAGDVVEYNAVVQTTDGAVVLGDAGALGALSGTGGGGEQGAIVTVCPTPSGGGGSAVPGPPGPPGPVGPPGTGIEGPFLKLYKVAMQDEIIPVDQNALGINTEIASGVTVTVSPGSLLLILGDIG